MTASPAARRLVLNEPETRLHSDLLAPLAQLIATATAHSRIIVVSHFRPLITAVERLAAKEGPELGAIEPPKEFGETRIVGQGTLDEPAWHWPKR